LDSFDSTTKKFKIPLLADSVSAGFPSPADDYTEEGNPADTESANKGILNFLAVEPKKSKT